MFIETVDRQRRNAVYIRADRVCGVKDWPGAGDSPSDAEVFLLGAPETLMVGEAANNLRQRIEQALAAK